MKINFTFSFVMLTLLSEQVLALVHKMYNLSLTNEALQFHRWSRLLLYDIISSIQSRPMYLGLNNNMFSDDLPWNWRKRKRNGVVFGRVHRNRSPFFLSCSKIIRSSHFQEHVGFLSYNIKISLVWSESCYAWSAKYHLFYG